MEKDVLDKITDGIDPSRLYRVSELVPLLGFSRSCLYRFIQKDYLRPYIVDKRHVFVAGEEVIFFCKHHRDWLERYSSYMGRKKLCEDTMPSYMGAHKKRGRPRIHRRRYFNKIDLKFMVFDACDMIKERFGIEYVTVRAVRTYLSKRTEDICPFVKLWKQQQIGLKPAKKAA